MKLEDYDNIIEYDRAMYKEAVRRESRKKSVKSSIVFILVILFLISNIIKCIDLNIGSVPVEVKNGMEFSVPSGDRVSHLKLLNNSADNYYAKFVNEDTLEEYCVYIVAFESFETMIPAGKYKLKTASGKTWYGEDELFGINTVFVENMDTLDFCETMELSITFNVVGGNMHPVKIPKARF